MAQAANVNVGLNLEYGSFVSGAQQARVAMGRALSSIQADTSKTAASLQSLTTGIKATAAAVGVGFGIQKLTQGVTSFATAVVKSGDELTNLKARLNLAVGEGAFTQVALSAEKLGVSVSTVASTMARLGNALKEVGVSRADLTTVTETLVQMGRVAGSTGAEIESALTQFSQGLSKGRLDGDELKGVLEAMPPLAQALAKELGVSVGELRDLGAEGKITSEVAIQAILNGAIGINEQFNKLGENLDQATARMQNEFQKLFAEIDKDLGASTFFKFLQGGAADMAAALRGQLEQGGIAGALFGTLVTGGPASTALTDLEAKLKGIQDQISVQKSRGQQTLIGALEQEAAKTTQEINRLNDAIERADKRVIRSDILKPGSGLTKPVLPSGRIYPAVSDKERVKDYLEFQKPLIDELAEAERKLGEERKQAADTAAKAKADLIAKLDEEVAASQRLTEAVGQGAYAQELANIENEKQSKIIELSKTLKGEDLEIQKKRVEQLAQEARIRASISTALPSGTSMTQRQAERESMDEYGKQAPAIAKDLSDAQQKAADDLNEIYQQPFKDLATALTNTLSEGIQDAISGDFDFNTFADSFGDIFADTLAASISAALTPALTDAAKSFGDVLTHAVQTATASATGKPGPQGAAPTLGYGGAALGGAAFGGIAGGLYGSYAPGMKPGNYAGIGGAIGGGLGAAAGVALTPVLGPFGPLIGAGVGSAAGSFLGGMFGGQNNLGNDRSAQAYRSGRGVVYSDRSFSQENRSITEGILSEVEALEKAFIGLGGVVNNVKLRIEAGTKSGITVNGKKYATAEDALRASIERLIGGTGGLSATQQTILANTRGGTAAEIGADLAFGDRYDELTTSGTQFDLALRNLGRAFEADARQAAELGLDVTALAIAREREAEEIQRQAGQAVRGVYEQLAAASGDTSVGTQLHVLETQMRELAAAAADLNIPLEAVTAAHKAAAAQIVAAAQEIARQADQTRRSIYEQIAALKGDVSLPTQLHILETQVRELAAAAELAGIPISEVTKAHQAAASILTVAYDQAKRGIAEQIAAARGDNSLGTQLHVLETQMRELWKSASAYGIALSEVTKAHEAAAKAIYFAYDQQVRGVAAQIARAGGNNSLGTQLYELETQMRDLAKAAEAVGIPLSEITKAHIKASEALYFAFDQQTRGVLEQLAAARGDTSLGAQLYAVETQMRELGKAAQAVGIPLSEVTKAHIAANQAIHDEFNARKKALQQQVEDLGQFGRPLDRSLAQLQSQVDELVKELTAAGLPIDRLAEAHKRAAKQIREDWEETLRAMRRQHRDLTQSIVEAQRNASGAIDQFLDPITDALSSRGIGQGVYSGAALSQSGLREFRSVLAEARTGDTGALSSLVGIGQGAISQARQTYGSTAEFARIFEEIQRGLREQEGVLEEKRDQLLRDIGDVGRETVDEIIRLRVQSIGDLRADLAKLSRDLIVAVEGRS